MLRNSQVALLQMLQVQKFSDSDAQSRTFGYCAMSLLADHDPKTQRDIKYLIENGYLNAQKSLTKKGELATTLHVKHFTNQEVGKRVNLFLYECLGRGIMKEAMKYWKDETLSSVFELLLQEVFERSQEDTFNISEDAAAYIHSFKDDLQEELSISIPESVLIEDQVTEASQVKEKTKRKTKAKEGVL